MDFCLFLSIFSFQKWKFFLTHLNHLGRQFFLYFLYFLIWSKKWTKLKKLTFVHGPFFQFLARKCEKYQFSWQKSVSNNFSMSNFYIFILCLSKVKYIYGRFHYVLMLGMVSLYSADFSVITRLVLVYYVSLCTCCYSLNFVYVVNNNKKQIYAQLCKHKLLLYDEKL